MILQPTAIITMLSIVVHYVIITHYELRIEKRGCGNGKREQKHQGINGRDIRRYS